MTHGAPGSPNSSSAYIGRAPVPKTGVVSQRYAKPFESEGIVNESDCPAKETLPSGS